MSRFRAPTDTAEWLPLRIGKVRTAFTALVLHHRDTARLRLLRKKLLGLTISQPGVAGKTALLSDQP